MELSIEEVVDIQHCYGVADGNYLQAQQYYTERFPRRR